jgi:hypothetical protein
LQHLARQADLATGRTREIKIKDAEGNEKTVQVGAYTETVKNMVPPMVATGPNGKPRELAKDVEQAIDPAALRDAFLAKKIPPDRYEALVQQGIDNLYGRGAYAMWAAESVRPAISKFLNSRIRPRDVVPQSQPSRALPPIATGKVRLPEHLRTPALPEAQE